MGSFPMAQWVEDPALSLLQLRPQLWCGFSPWRKNFHMLWAWPEQTIFPYKGYYCNNWENLRQRLHIIQQ